MNQSFPNSFGVRGTLGPGQQPTPIARAAEVMQRVLVRNLDDVNPVHLATELNSLFPAIQSDVFTLPAQTSEVFPLAPGQKLYARFDAGVAIGNISVFTSDAFPIDPLSKE